MLPYHLLSLKDEDINIISYGENTKIQFSKSLK